LSHTFFLTASRLRHVVYFVTVRSRHVDRNGQTLMRQSAL